MNKDKAARNLFWPVSLLIGLVFNLLFWGQGWGLNYPLAVGLVLSAGLWLARRVKLAMWAGNWALVGLGLGLALLTLWRREPFSLFVNWVIVLLILATLTASFVKGRWRAFRLVDFVLRFSLMPFQGWAAYRGKGKEGDGNIKESRAGAIGRGLVLALPILVVLGALLASADYAFAEWLERAFGWLNIENFIELIWRGFWVAVVSVIALVVYSYALLKSEESELFREGKELFKPFLGFVESSVVLGSVILLFAIFVGVQLRYFFGGVANISEIGFTYAEYARRGFAELVVVALISVALYMALSLVGKRERKSQERTFSWMSLGLLSLVGVMLYSAFQRLLLYEEVYGFTRTRTNVHVFMVLLGLFLVALVLMEFLARRRPFAGMLAVSLLIYGVALPALNVDAFVVRANVQNYQRSGVIDVAYLASLSSNAVLAMVSQVEQLEGEEQAPLLAAIACYEEINQSSFEEASWQEFAFADRSAQPVLDDFAASEAAGRVGAFSRVPYGQLSVSVDGQEFVCAEYYYD